MFREKIKLAIGAKNIKIGALAKQCGIVTTSLSAYLSGQRGLKQEQLEKLMERLDLSLQPKSDFRFHSDFMEKQEAEREAKIAERIGRSASTVK